MKLDTIFVNSDSIRISEVVTQFEYIEKPLGKWDAFILRFGMGAFWVLVGVAVLGAVLLFLRFKKGLLPAIKFFN